MRRQLMTVAVCVLILTLIGLNVNRFAFAGAGTPTAISTAVSTAISTVARTPTGTSTALPIPIALTVDRTYYHSSGLFSMPRVVGWQLLPGYENTYVPALPTDYGWVSAVFFNAPSVVHVIVERPASLRLRTVQDLDRYFNHDYYVGAWALFKDGFKETKRRLTGGRFSADFQLQNGGESSVGRQLSRLDHGWIVTLRLVAPANDPALLDRLENVLWQSIVFYPDEAAVPLSWTVKADSDSGNFVKYPTDWIETPDSSGGFIASGKIRSISASLLMKFEPRLQVGSMQDARKWVTAFSATAKLLTVQRETRSNATGYSVSFNDLSGDTPQSGVVTLLNGRDGGLHALVLVASIPKVDFLAAFDNPLPEFALIRNTFMLLPPTTYLPTPQPSATVVPQASVTPAPTVVVTATLDPGVFDMNAAPLYKTQDGLLDMRLPRGWQSIPLPEYIGFQSYNFSLDVGTPLASIAVNWGQPVTLYAQILNISASASSPTAALGAFANNLRRSRDFQAGDIHAAKLGAYDGFGLSVTSVSDDPHTYDSEIRVAELPDGQVFTITTTNMKLVTAQAKPAFEQMIDSLVIRPKLAPTATQPPTSTPIPPTDTPVPTSTPTNTALPSPTSTQASTSF